MGDEGGEWRVGLPRDGIHGKEKKVSGMMSKGSNLLLGFGHA